MRDAGGELAERGELLRLHQAILGGAQILQRCGEFARACLHLSNRRTFSIAITAWSAKVDASSICLSVNGRTSERVKLSTPDRNALAQHRDSEDRSIISQLLHVA